VHRKRSFWTDVAVRYNRGVFFCDDGFPYVRCRSCTFYSRIFSAPVGAVKGKGKVYPYSGPGADSGVQAVSSRVNLSHPPGGRLSLLSAEPAVISVAFTRWRYPYTVADIAIPAYYSFIDPERMKG